MRDSVCGLMFVLAFAIGCADSDAGSATSAATGGSAAELVSGAGAPVTAGSGAGVGGSSAAAPSSPGVATPIAGAGSGAAGATGANTPSVTTGTCCGGGDCLCRGAPPTALSAEPGPHATLQYELKGVGCVFYPSDAPPPFAAVAIAEGFGGSGGCASVQTGKWGPLYASHGIVAMIVETGSGDQPALRAKALTDAIAAFKAENERSDSPLRGKLAGRYGTAGFSMGGGGSTYAVQADSSLRSSVAIMPWGPAQGTTSVPTLIICGASDGIAPCTSHGTPAYTKIDAKVPKMRVEVSGGHNGQPGDGVSSPGAYGLAFQKVFLEGDERWRPLLVAAASKETTIR